MRVIRSRRVLIDAEIRAADVVIDRAYIAEVIPYNSADVSLDMGDRLIVPGFVDLHSDAVEKEIEPRPGAYFPVDSAIVELDKKLAACGITTMFHAIAFYEESVVGTRGTEMGTRIANRIRYLNDSRLAVDNLVHVRYEATSFGSIPAILQLLQEGTVHLLSFMDHTPGQGQYASLENWLKDHKAAFGMGDEKARQVIDIMAEKKSLSGERLVKLAQCARQLNIPLVSHDDDSVEKINYMKELGVSVSEFPTNEEAAFYARRHTLDIGLGAPNVVRGSSQNDNVSARRLIDQGVCDFLCSDYHPPSMLQAVYVLNRQLDMELASAFQLVSRNPARIAGLSDRGRIARGCRADLAVIDESFLPSVALTIKSGVPVYNGLGAFDRRSQAETTPWPKAAY